MHRSSDTIATIAAVFGIEPPRPRVEAVHENAKTELKALMPDDAKEAIGHGIRAKRSKSGAVSFDVLSVEGSHAPLQ